MFEKAFFYIILYRIVNFILLTYMKDNTFLLTFLVLIVTLLVLTPGVYSKNLEKSVFNHYNNSTYSLTHSNDMIPELFSRVNESRLYEYIERISAFGPHPTGSDTLDEVTTYIYDLFLSMNIPVSYDPWETDMLQGNNIVATLSGRTDNTLIVTAHADTVEVSPGADDDGSGISSLLMIAELLQPYTFNATIKFIIFTGEENGVLGSKAYAKRSFEDNEKIIGVLSLDKIGYAETNEEGSRIRHHANMQSAWMSYISRDISERYEQYIGLEVVRLPFDGSSDHRAFVEYGYSGSNLVEDALNPVYHTSEDTIEYINISYVSKVTRLALGTIFEIATINPSKRTDDIDIVMTGSYHSSPSRLTIKVVNNRFEVDSVNVTISIELKHIVRDSYVSSKKEFYMDPLSWNFSKEIIDVWEFKIGPRVCTQGLFIITVGVYGIKDDIGLFKEESLPGIIIYPNYMFLIH